MTTPQDATEATLRAALLPCPFDGGAGIPNRTERAGYDDFPDDPDRWAYTVRCQSCAAEGPWTKSSPDGAATRWNNRAALAPKPSVSVEAACVRSVGGVLCTTHDGSLWPSLSHRCNGWQDEAALRASVTPPPLDGWHEATRVIATASLPRDLGSGAQATRRYLLRLLDRTRAMTTPQDATEARARALPCEDPEEPCDADGRDEHRWCDNCIARSVLAADGYTVMRTEDVDAVVRGSSPYRNCRYSNASRASCPEVNALVPDSWCSFCQAHTRLRAALGGPS